MPTTYLSKLTLPVNVEGTVTNVEFTLKDAEARQMIEDLGHALYWIGVTTTALTDLSTTNPIVVPGKYEEVDPVGTENPSELGWYEYDESTEQYVLSEDVTVDESKTYFTTSIVAKLGGLASYSGSEFVWNGSAWQELGKNNFGALAFKSSAEGSYTPAGTVAITKGTDTTTSITPVTAVGTLPSWTVSNETATFVPGTLPTQGTAVDVVTERGTDTAAFTGTAATVTVE